MYEVFCEEKNRKSKQRGAEKFYTLKECFPKEFETLKDAEFHKDFLIDYRRKENLEDKIQIVLIHEDGTEEKY